MKRSSAGNNLGDNFNSMNSLEVKRGFFETDNDSASSTVNCNETREVINTSILRCSHFLTGRNKLKQSFFDVPCEYLAKSLVGKVLVRSFSDGLSLRGRIVETECYLGGNDKASHSYNGKKTPRNKPMYMKPGTTYVYFTYGMYFCFNISSQGDGAAVLLRAVDPLEGHEFMNEQRIKKRTSGKKKQSSGDVSGKTLTLKPHELCNGPGKLCISFGIDDKSCNMKDLCTWEEMWIETDDESSNIDFDDLIISTRIGLNSVAEEWALKPLRFYLYGNRSVSKRDKIKEQLKK